MTFSRRINRIGSKEPSFVETIDDLSNIKQLICEKYNWNIEEVFIFVLASYLYDLLKQKDYDFTKITEYDSLFIESSPSNKILKRKKSSPYYGLYTIDNILNDPSEDSRMVLYRPIYNIHSYSETLIFCKSKQTSIKIIDHLNKLTINFRKESCKENYINYVLDDNANVHIELESFGSVDVSRLIYIESYISKIESSFKSSVKDHPDYERLMIPRRRGIILHGPPGCGKTTFVQHITKKYNIPLVVPKLAYIDINDLKELFTFCESISPCAILFEDFDSLLTRDEDKTDFLNALDGISTNKNIPILVIATTNYLEKIDPAFTHRPSRFDRIFEIKPPAEDTRKIYFNDRFTAIDPYLTEELKNIIVKKTANFSFSHLNEVYIQIALNYIDGTIIDEKMIKDIIDNVSKETKDKGQIKGFD